jgi:N,N-dimethylformamidase beta subunit-like protein
MRLGLAVLLLLLVPSAAWAGKVKDPEVNPVATENDLDGTSRWDITPPDKPAIEGYASESSAAPGHAFHLHVRAGTAGDRYRVNVYRLGWYGGDGGRLVTCIPGCESDRAYVAQPAVPRPEPDTGLVRAGWSVTDVVEVGRDWVSGYYLAQLRVTSGPDEGAVGRVPLVVRGPPGDAAAILVQVPVNTWQAYNPWGGKSLYTYNSTGEVAATKVSFDRPYSENVLVDVPWSLEVQAVHFLEREGYDVSYATDVDVDRSPSILLNHRLAMSIGHDEYWSRRQRDGFDIALDRSTNIAALGANAAYWQIRYEDAHRTVVSWRSPEADPVKSTTARTTQFRALEPGRPECRLFGVMYAYNAQRWAGSPPTSYGLAAPSDDPWLLGTGIERRDDIPDIVGYEWDTLMPGCFPGRVTRLLHSEPRGEDKRVHPADAVRGVARSGARMFATGTLEFSWSLDSFGNHLPSRRIQVLMENAVDDLTRPAPPRPVDATAGRSGVSLHAHRRRDPRVRRIAIYAHSGAGRFDPDGPGAELVCKPVSGACRDHLRGGTVRYAAVALDRWGRSAPWYSAAVRVAR